MKTGVEQVHRSGLTAKATAGRAARRRDVSARHQPRHRRLWRGAAGDFLQLSPPHAVVQVIDLCVTAGAAGATEQSSTANAADATASTTATATAAAADGICRAG